MRKFIILLSIIGVTIPVNAQNHTLSDYVHCINYSNSTFLSYLSNRILL